MIIKNKKIRGIIIGLVSSIILLILLSSISVLALGSENVTRNVCCEKTIYNAYCQNAPADQCLTGLKTNNSYYQNAPTSCESTSYCKLGCCYDSDEGLCMENTPKEVCLQNNGAWSDERQCNIPQCKLGCCVLGTQAAFVPLVRCKKLSGFYGLETDFRAGITTEDSCIAVAQSADEGACVYEKEFDVTCKFTTRQACKEISKAGGLSNTSVTFYKDYLCSNPELATNCGASEETTCVDGKDEVYFKDTCGNPANIYDSTKKNDTDYWKKIVSKAAACNNGKDNSNSKSCGNCDYFLGSMCKKRNKERGDAKPDVGDYICRNLDCKNTTAGKTMKHGESWCMFDAVHGHGTDIVGSQQFRHICLFGEDLVEPCADYRAQVCLEDNITTSEGSFSQAGCRVNRWQDCLAQDNEEDCDNTDKRDCFWLNQSHFPNGTGLGDGGCLPMNPPGLKFWDGNNSDASAICGQATSTVNVTYVAKGIGAMIGTADEDCDEECWALEKSSALAMGGICKSLGDCGAYINIAGKVTDGGFEWKIDDEKQNISLSAALLKSQLKISDLSGSSGGKRGLWG